MCNISYIRFIFAELMDIRKISAEELKVGSFAFMDLNRPVEIEWQGQPVLFDGAVFGFCMRGEFAFRINYREFRVAAGEMFVSLPRHLFSALDVSPDAELKLLLVSSDFLYALPVSFGFDWLRRVETSPCLKPDAKTLKDLVGLYAVMERYDASDDNTRQIRDALMLPFLLIIISSIECRGAEGGLQSISRSELLVRRFFDLLSQCAEIQRKVSFYADRLCVTPKNLSVTVKNTTGRTPQEWINEAVVVMAKHNLRTTDLSVFQISEKLHFATASTFVRFFRQHTGLTPLEFRRR